jgi:flagellar biosynthesis/type III secretory pathway protein FliH
MDFLRYYIRFEKADNRAKFEKGIDQLTNNKLTMGLEQFLLERANKEGIEQGVKQGVMQGVMQGMKQGREAEKKSLVVNMINKTLLSDQQIAEVAETTVDFVAQLRQQLAGGAA